MPRRSTRRSSGDRPDVIVPSRRRQLPAGGGAGARRRAYDVNVAGRGAPARRRSPPARRGTMDPVVLIVGSGAQYGRHDAVRDAAYARPPRSGPLTVYAASKAAQEVDRRCRSHRERGREVDLRAKLQPFGRRPGALSIVLPSLVAAPCESRRRPAGHAQARATTSSATTCTWTTSSRAYLCARRARTAGRGVQRRAADAASSVRQLATDVLLRVGATADISTDAALQRATDMPVLVGSPAKLTRTPAGRPTRRTSTSSTT